MKLDDLGPPHKPAISFVRSPGELWAIYIVRSGLSDLGSLEGQSAVRGTPRKFPVAGED